MRRPESRITKYNQLRGNAMSWTKRDSAPNLVFLGDESDQKKKAGGLLAAIVPDRFYPEKVNYELVQKDGESIVLSGSASLRNQINERDVGRFIKCEFTGWDKSKNGKYKVIEVDVWEGDVTPEMQKWPRWKELHASNGKAAPAKVDKASEPDDDGFGEQEDEDDDLPFN